MEVHQEMIRFDRVRHINAQVSQIRYLKEHMHGAFELSYVLDGNAKYYHGTEMTILSPGDCVLTNPYEPHSYVAQGDGALMILTVKIHKLFMRRYVERIPKLKFNCRQLQSLPLEQKDTVKEYLLRTAISYYSNSASQQFDIVANAMLLMGKLVSYLEWELEENPDSADWELQRNRVQRLVSYIDENYRQKITLSMLAQMEGISTTYLSHFFKKAFGVSFQTYLSMQRFEKALVLMHDKSISIVDICMNCGFSDSRYLEAACQRTFGCSVAEYRDKCQNMETGTAATEGDVLFKVMGWDESIEVIRTHLGAEQYAALS